MRIAVVHSQYRGAQPSGENIAVAQQTKALREAGLEVLEVYRSTDIESQKPFYSVKSALSIATGWDFGNPDRALRAFAPDIVHVHNTVPNFGTRWLARLSVPVVTTLHNFRASCANGLLYRNGAICVRCPTSGSSSAVVHGCYQGSWSASLPVAISIAGGAGKNRLINASAAVITQSSRVHEFMLQQGVPKRVLHLIPGFVEERHSLATSPPQEPKFIFVGRVTPEKGLHELLNIWPDGFMLNIVGTEGPGSNNQEGSTSVRYFGDRSREWISETLPSHTALIFPGRVWEGAYPLVVREALEAGVPIVALAGSGAADLVASSAVGATYDDADQDSLVVALRSCIEGGLNLRTQSRVVFEREMTQHAWIESVLELYRQILR